MENTNNLDGFPSKDNDRTRAFSVGKKQRRNDSISWIIGALLLFFLNIISLARITIVGQFIDDIIFTLPFGWFKYIIYLLLFLFDFSLYFGIKFKFKKKFIFMVVVIWFILCWIISSILFITAYYTKSTEFKIDNILSATILKDVYNSYFHQWKSSSLWGEHYKGVNWFISDPNTYFTIWAGGGLIGTTLAGISSYLSIFGSLILSLIALFFGMVWILTGDTFYLFKSKENRKGKRLRILSLRGPGRKNKIKKPDNREKWSIFEALISGGDEIIDEIKIIDSISDSDMTIELPSFYKNNTFDLYNENQGNLNMVDKNNSRMQNKNVVGRTTDLRPELEDELHNNFEGKGYKENQLKNNSLVENYIPNNRNNFNNNYESNNRNNFNNNYESNNRNNFNNGFDNFNSNNNQNIEKPNNQYNNFDSNQYNLDNNFDINQNNNFQANINNPQNDIYNNDLIIPNEGKYGNISTESSRKEFEKETSVTPFGMNGKTTEFFSKKNTKIKQKNDHPGQMSVDDVLEESNNLNFEQQQDYISPIANKIHRETNRNFDWGSQTTGTIEIQKNAPKKEIFINKNYELPSTSLLEEKEASESDIRDIEREIDKKGSAINSVFDQFGVKASIIGRSIGPSVTKFEILPDPGTKVNAVISLENDLKLALASKNVRIEAPIPGKAAIGIEVANIKSQIVPIKSVLIKTPLNKLDSKLFFPIGKTVTGELLMGELNTMPHLLVAGSTGSGKSVMINGVITSILMRAKPHEVKFLMIDPKKVELSIYSNIPHLLAPVISDMNMANNALKKVICEMDRRYSLFTENNVKNIDGYNSKQRFAKDKIPYYVIVIDELADLMMTANKRDVEDSIMRLTQMARAAGIHLIVATQRPSTDVLTGVIKSNIPTRIAFSVASSIDSRTILDSMGAEKLIGKGDLLYMSPGSNGLIRAQGTFVSDDEIMKIVDFCSRQQEQQFDDEFTNIELDNTIGGNISNGGSNDSLYEQVKDYVISTQRASTSLLQRKFSIGYNRAAKIIDDLENEDVIGPANGAKSREVYIKYSN